MLRKFSRRSWILALTLALGLSSAVGVVAYARMLRGDIDIASTDMGPPLRSSPVIADPNLKYAYDCQLELNDWKEGRVRKIVHEGREHPYELFAVARVTLTQDKRGVGSGELKWKWIAAIADERNEGKHVEIPLAAPPADAFSLAAHSLAINAGRGDNGEVNVTLFATVNLPVGSYFHSGNGVGHGTLDSGPLSLQAEVFLARSAAPNPRGEPDQLNRRLFVECVRKR